MFLHTPGLTWLVSQRCSAALSPSQGAWMEPRKQRGRASVCVCKIHVSLITENLNSGRLSPALCLDTSYTYRVWTVNVVVRVGHPISKSFETAPMSTPQQYGWWMPSTRFGSIYNIHITVLAGRLSRSVMISTTNNKSPCSLLEAKSVPGRTVVSRLKPDKGRAHGVVPTRRYVCSGACIMKQHEPIFGLNSGFLVSRSWITFKRGRWPW